MRARICYNTYQHSGLPPGPITNPGLAAISAALAPADTNYLYIVAKPGGGGHQFSTNLAQHEKATREYRHGSAKKGPESGLNWRLGWPGESDVSLGSEFQELRRVLAPVSESYLRKLLRESGFPLAPLVEGVRQATLDELETSLLRLLEEYHRAGPDRRTAVRRLVITAKDHARWAARREEQKSTKQEMILWMTTWLENPPVFREWLILRKSKLS